MLEKEHLCERERQKARQLINSNQGAGKKFTYEYYTQQSSYTPLEGTRGGHKVSKGQKTSLQSKDTSKI